MRLKKTAKSNLENKKSLFFEIGLTIALGMALVAFEWATPEITNSTPYYEGKNIFDDDFTETPRTFIKPPPLYVPPPAFVFNPVDDEAEIEDDPIDWDVDADGNTTIEIPELPDEQPDTGDPIFFPEKYPQYQGGDLTNFRNHIQSIVEYPEEAIRMQIEGKVFVQFVVDKKGDIVDIQIVKTPDPLLDNAVLAAIKKTDRWVPGEQAGRKVKVAMSMPISFRLSY